MTRHDWIFDVLKDLRTYAQANGLPALAAKAEEAIRVARAEISADDPQAGTGSGGSPPSGRAH